MLKEYTFGRTLWVEQELKVRAETQEEAVQLMRDGDLDDNWTETDRENKCGIELESVRELEEGE